MEFKAKAKKLKITAADGTAYEMRCPTIGDIETLQTEVEATEPKNVMKVYIKFFESLGLPEHASKAFDQDDFTEFITFVLNPKKKSVTTP